MHSVGRECFHRFLVTLAQQTHRAIRRRIVQITRLEQGQCRRQFAIANGLQGLPVGLRQIGLRGLMGDAAVDAAALLGNFRQITRAVAGNQHGGARLLEGGVHIRLPVALRAGRMEFVVQQTAQIAEHPAHARIVELRGDGRIHRHVLVVHLERHAVAFPLLAHIAKGVFRAAPVEFIEHHQLGVIEHVDFFQLAGRTEVGRHHIHREIDQIDDFGIGLTNSSSFHDDQIEALPLQAGDGVFQHGIGGHVLAAGGHRAHEQVRRAQAVHPDTVAQQGAAAAPTGRIDRNHRDAHVREMLQEAVQQFIGDRALAGPAGAGQADDRGFAAGQLPLPAQVLQFGFAEAFLLDGGQQAADGVFISGTVAAAGFGITGALGAGHQIFDHRHQTHLHAIVRVIDALHAIGFQLGDFIRGDGTAPAAEHADVRRAGFVQAVNDVFEVLDMATLIARQRDAVGVFLQGRTHHVIDRAVVAQMHHFRALGLDQPAHDIDGGIMAVEQRGGGDETQGGFVRQRLTAGHGRTGRHGTPAARKRTMTIVPR